MKQRKPLGILLAILLLIGGILLINRDLFRYENNYVYKLKLERDINEKKDYFLSAPDLVLKPGVYSVRMTGDFLGAGSGFFVRDEQGDALFSADLKEGQENTYQFEITGGAKHIIWGVSYDPAYSDVYLEKLILSSDSVLYKESLIRHGIITLFFAVILLMLSLRFLDHELYRRLFPKLSEPETEKALCLLILLTALSCFPMLQKERYTNGDDLYFHFHHIRGIAASLKAGYFPPRIHLDWIENYGFGCGFYYPDAFLWIAAFLYLAGFSIFASYHIFLVLCTFFSLVTMYMAAHRISGSRRAASLSTALYAFASYRLLDVFFRAALGEIQAFVFMPLVVLGLYEIYHGRPEKWGWFALGFAGLLLSHVISTAICGIFAALYVLIRIRETLTNKRVFQALLKSVLMVLGCGAFFLLPMLEQSMTVKLKINDIISGGLASAGYTEFKEIFRFHSLWTTADERKVFVGWAFLLILLLRVIFIRRIEKTADTLSLFAVLAVILCTDVIPWGYLINLLSRIQFAWRFMMVAAVLFPISCGIYGNILTEGHKWRYALLYLAAFICGLPILIDSVSGYSFSKDHYYYIQYSNSLSGAEYLPLDFDRTYAEGYKDSVFADVPDYEIKSRKREGLTFTFSYKLSGTDQALFTVPLVYYTGYQADLNTPDGEIKGIPIQLDPMGLIQVSSEGHPNGEIRVHYEKTTVQIVSEIISVISLIIAGWLWTRSRKKSPCAGS